MLRSTRKLKSIKVSCDLVVKALISNARGHGSNSTEGKINFK